MKEMEHGGSPDGGDGTGQGKHFEKDVSDLYGETNRSKIIESDKGLGSGTGKGARYNPPSPEYH